MRKTDTKHTHSAHNTWVQGEEKGRKQDRKQEDEMTRNKKKVNLNALTEQAGRGGDFEATGSIL